MEAFGASRSQQPTLSGGWTVGGGGGGGGGMTLAPNGSGHSGGRGGGQQTLQAAVHGAAAAAAANAAAAQAAQVSPHVEIQTAQVKVGPGQCIKIGHMWRFELCRSSWGQGRVLR